MHLTLKYHYIYEFGLDFAFIDIVFFFVFIRVFTFIKPFESK